MLNVELQSNAKSFWSRGVFLFVILTIIDQVSKYFAGDIHQNYNFAFSLPLHSYAMYGIYLAGIGGIISYLIKYYRILPFKALVSWTMIFSGAVSNVGERIVLGYVRDWIHIGSGIFNLADGYIIIGMITLFLNSKSESLNSKP